MQGLRYFLVKKSGIATTTKSEWWRMWGAGALIAMLVKSALPCP